MHRTCKCSVTSSQRNESRGNVMGESRASPCALGRPSHVSSEQGLLKGKNVGEFRPMLAMDMGVIIAMVKYIITIVKCQ